jgi:hypothetical protein
VADPQGYCIEYLDTNRQFCLTDLVEGGTLNFYDAPADPLLPSGTAISFFTELAGITASGPVFFPEDIFTWTDSFNGTSGGISVTANNAPVDANSGSGGIVVTSIDGVATVAEPPAWTLFMIGLLPVCFLRARKVCRLKRPKGYLKIHAIFDQKLKRAVCRIRIHIFRAQFVPCFRSSSR